MFTRKNLIILSRILFSLFITCLFMTCDPGLGKAVDTQAPKVSIDYPAPKEVLKDSFTMTGVASDEVKVASCEVAFRNIKTGSVYKFPANVANDKFSVTINTPKPDGSFELPDGDYNVTVSVSDAYRNSTQDIVYTIDNTAPTVLITSPNSYSESNWPNMYKTFSIKGEVYDATNISEVIVYLVDVNGTVLKQVVAEGTNTFSARFDNPFGEEKVCFYYAVAKDAGGNVNTYCYHSSDIRKLLANASQHSETTSFPSINSIGYVDQGQEKNLTDQIDESALIKVKIDNNKAEKKANSFPGFNYFAKDTAQVQWLNISKESPAGIAIGTPVLGTIMPPTDQSAFDYDSITVWIASRVHDPSDDINDPSAEIKFEPFSDSNKLECCTIRDDSEDGNKQVKLKPVGESINFQIDSHPGNNDNWKTGDYKVKIYFKTDSNVEGSDECIFKVNSGAPKLTEGNFAENEFSSYYRGYMTAETVSSNKNYLSGKSLTSDEASPVTLSWKYVGSTISGNKIDSPEYSKVPGGDGSYKIDIDIDANTHENDGEYTYTITADPESTLSTVISRVVVIDTTNPVIILNNLENGRILDEGSYTVKGNIDDANGIKEVHYKLFADETQITLDGSPANDWILIDGAKSTVELKLSNLEVNKNYTLKLRATDIAGNTNGENDYTYTFTLDNVKPEISTTVSPLIMYDNDGNPDTAEEETVNGTIKVNTKVSDSNKLKAVYYTFNPSLAEDVDWSTQNKFTDVELSNGKIIEIDTTKYDDKSKLPLRIKAIDGAGNYTIKIVNPVINQESDRPMIDPSNFDKPEKVEKFEDSGWIGTTSFNVFGSSNPNMIFTVLDDDSVKGFCVKIDDNEYGNMINVNSAQKIMTYSVENLSFGRHTVTFKIIDVNNIAVEKTYYVAIDDGQPTLVVNNVNNEYVGDSFNISGSVIDKNGIYEVKINNQKLTIGNGLTENADGYKFTYSFPVPEEQVLIQIIAVDLIGNTSIKELTYCVDKTSPVLDVFATDSAYVDIEYPSLRIAGTATDGDLSFGDNGISGIDQVRLKIGSSITSVDDADSILAIGKIENGVMSWSSPLDFTGKLAGNYTVYIQAFDHAGNKSEEKIITVYVDTDTPKLKHEYEENFVGSYRENFTISGTASDASGVKSVTAKIQGATGNLSVTFNETTNNSDSAWSFTVPKSSGDGQLTILVTATDGCGKSVQETFTATLDTEAPSVTFTDISDDNDDNNTTIETSKTTDKPRVSVTYADSTSGVNSVEYTFYYYDPNGNISGLTPDADGFIDYSDVDGNASGSFTRDKSFSGTVVMRMAESTGSTGAFINTETNTDGIWYVKVTITDEAGNSAEYDSPYFYVDQHKPVLNVTSPASSVNLKKQNDALEVTGTTSDSYGGDIDKVVVKIYHPSYNASQQANFTKTFTKDGSNGTETLTKNGESYQFTYTWNGANSPFVYPDVYELLVSTYDVAGNETVRTPQKISCDNTAPTITVSRPYSYSVDAFGNVNEGIVVNSPIGDTSIKALADDYSMASIYYQIGGTVDIEATGSIGSSNYKITKLTVENGGVGTDTYGTLVTDVKLDGVNIALAGNWNRFTSGNSNFDVEYNTLNMVNAGKTYHADGDKETIQTLDVHFVAVDTAGNINYCKYPLKVDTDTDKPTLLMLSPKTINDVANVGGTATISGTVNDDNAVHSVWMQVELVNGNYSGDILFGFSPEAYNVANLQALEETTDGSGKTVYSVVEDNEYFKDKSKWYKVNLGAENSTSTTWNMMLNKNGEFDIAELKKSGSLPNDDELKQIELLIKVKALDTKAADGLSISPDAKAGDSTEFRLIIDSGSPSIIFNNIADFPAEGSYIGGNITFDLEFSDDQSITEWKLEAISTASGDNSSMLIASDEYSGSYEDGLGKTVTPVADGKYVGSNGIITVDTADIYAQCGNLIQFKISAKDNSKDSNSETESPKESYLTFKYTIDNSAPDASYVSTIDGNSYYIDTESIEGDLTGAHRESVARGNHLRIMSNQAAFTGKVFDEANGSGIDYVMLYFTKGNRLYNPSEVDSSFEISNHLTMKDVNGNSVSPLAPVGSLKDVVRTSGTSNPYIVVDRAEGMLDSGANGDLDGYDENLKANGDWVVYIKSSNLPDGVYDIHYVVVDFAGNARYYSDTMLVQNYAPTINSIVLATDIDGDGEASIGNDDKGDEYQKFVTGEFTSTGFNVRNSKLKIKVNVTGGTGNLKYYLRYKTKTGEITTDKNNSGYSTGIFDISDFLGDSATPVDYVVWVEDSVEQNLSLSSGETTIDMIMDNEDDVAPVAQFFELNTIVEDSATSNEERGNLFKANGSVKGHIEPRVNSPVDNTDGKDPDVSGTIILRGEVFDNQRIESIVLRLNDTNVTIAKWNPNLSLLELKDANAKIYDSLGLLGHYVEWQYAWDTNSFAKYDTDVKVIVTDSAGKVSGNKDYSSDNTNTPRTESNKFTLDNWGYNSMTVDVVPYITGLGTTLSRIEKRNPSVYGRSTLGKYPVYYYRKTVSEGKESEEITVEGFNILSGSTVTFEGGATTSLDVNKVFTLHENAKSGKIFVTVSEVPSLNNANDNGAVGSSGEYYNQKPNGQNNDLLTDDIELLIWEINSKAAIAESGELSEVMMHVNPYNGMLGFAFAHSQDLASYPNGNNNSYETWITDWTGVNQISFAYDKNGNMFGTNGGTDTYTPNKKVGRLGLISSHWGVITNTSASNDWYSGYTKYRRLRLEYLGLLRNNAYASNVYRFAKGDAIQLATTNSETSGTNLYMLYYDNTLGELKFKAGNFDSHTGAIHNSASGDKWTKSDLFFGDFSDDAHYEKASDSSNNYEPTYKTISIVANQNGANGDSNVRPGIYYSVDAIYSSRDQSDVVVAVWYDDVNKKLWYSYLVKPLDKAGERDDYGAISTEWATPIAILDGHAGGYCAIKADDAGHIHIAAYSRNDAGSLYYAYLDKYDSNYNEDENLVAVDAYGSTGQYITMEVANNGNGKYIPYIGYYMSSMSYPKYAYLVDTESAKAGDTYYPKPGVDENSMFTGAWETVLLPTTSTIVIDDINIGVYKNSDGTLKSIPKQTESVGVKNGIAGGNDTSNPIFAYGISQTGSGYIETAQLK